MDTIFGTADERFLRTVVLYGKTSNNYLHVDSGCTDKAELTKDKVKQLFLSGMTICYDGDYYTPLACTDETTYMAVSFATDIQTPTEVTLYSNEYSG